MNEIEILNRDLDLFCLINNKPVHIATAGGIIPKSLESGIIFNCTRKMKECDIVWPNYDVGLNPVLRLILNYDQQTENIYLVLNTIYPDSFENLTNEELYRKYIQDIYGHSFINMACKGFWSYDKTNLAEPEDDVFHLVASPFGDNTDAAYEFCMMMNVPRIETNEEFFYGFRLNKLMTHPSRR